MARPGHPAVEDLERLLAASVDPERPESDPAAAAPAGDGRQRGGSLGGIARVLQVRQRSGSRRVCPVGRGDRSLCWRIRLRVRVLLRVVAVPAVAFREEESLVEEFLVKSCSVLQVQVLAVSRALYTAVSLCVVFARLALAVARQDVNCGYLCTERGIW